MIDEEKIKVAIINGKSSDKDGKIDYLIAEDENCYHAVLLEKYLKNNYIIKDEDDVDLNNANCMSLFLREKDNIVFLNTTTYKNGRPSVHGKTGVVIFPNTITENQKDSITQLNNIVSDFDDLSVWYEFSSRYECKSLFTKNKQQVKTILDDIKDKIQANMTK